MSLEYNQQFIPIVLCAGFGTRLKPITNIIPKVICPIIDKPISFFSIEKFFNSGFEHVYCNIHYKAEMLRNELKACAKNFGYDPDRIVFFHEKEILGSGGGILHIVKQLRSDNEENNTKDVIVVSGDVVADFPLENMITSWREREENTLAIMLSVELEEDRDDVLCVSSDGTKVIGFGKSFLENNKDMPVQKRMFSNHQIIDSKCFHNMDIQFGSSIDFFYKKILNQNNKKILHFNYPRESYWFNVGDMNEYQKCVKFFCEERNIAYPPQYKMHAEYPSKLINLLPNNTP